MDSTACIIIRTFKKVTKGGDPYIEFKVKDDLGKLFQAKRWNASEEELSLKEGDIIIISGKEDEWNGHKYINIRQLIIDKDGTVDRRVFLLGLDSDTKARYVERFNSFISGVSKDYYGELLNVIFNDEFRENEFYLFPAGVEKHHDKFGGLLQHTVEVAGLSLAIATALEVEHPHIDKDLIITGALLHDIGKTRTYDISKGIAEIRDIEYMIGHAVYAIEMVGFAEKILKKDYKLVRHLLASHQGKREYNAVAVPCTKEALIVSRADELSSQLSVFDNLDYDESGKAWYVGGHTYIYRYNKGEVPMTPTKF